MQYAMAAAVNGIINQPRRSIHSNPMRSDCIIPPAMFGNGWKIAGTTITGTHQKMVQLGWRKMAAIAFAGWIGAGRGTAIRRTCGRLTVAGTAPMSRTATSVFVSPGPCDFDLCALTLCGVQGRSPCGVFLAVLSFCGFEVLWFCRGDKQSAIHHNHVILVDGVSLIHPTGVCRFCSFCWMDLRSVIRQ